MNLFLFFCVWFHSGCLPRHLHDVSCLTSRSTLYHQRTSNCHFHGLSDQPGIPIHHVLSIYHMPTVTVTSFLSQFPIVYPLFFFSHCNQALFSVDFSFTPALEAIRSLWPSFLPFSFSYSVIPSFSTTAFLEFSLSYHSLLRLSRRKPRHTCTNPLYHFMLELDFCRDLACPCPCLCVELNT